MRTLVSLLVSVWCALAIVTVSLTVAELTLPITFHYSVGLTATITVAGLLIWVFGVILSSEVSKVYDTWTEFSKAGRRNAKAARSRR